MFVYFVDSSSNEIDRPIVAALAKLARASLVDPERIVIDQNGRVRLLNVSTLDYCSPHQRKQLEADAEQKHWRWIRAIFDWIPYFPITEGPYWIMKAASTILAPTPSPGRLLTIHVGLKPGLRAHIVEDQTTSRHRKRVSTRVNPKALNFGTLQFCRWALDKVLRHAASSSKRRRMTASGTPLLHIPNLLRTDQVISLLRLAPEPEDKLGGASIVAIK
jgi:hypothetical protein